MEQFIKLKKLKVCKRNSLMQKFASFKILIKLIKFEI